MSRNEESYRTLLHDNFSGSSDILRNTIEWLGAALEQAEDQDRVMAQLKILCNTHPSMALLHNLYTFLEHEGPHPDKIDSWMNKYRKHEQTVCREFAAHLAHFTSILVHSYSGLLYRSIESIPKALHVYATESRPAFEGRTLAEKLAETHHKIYLVSDMAAFSVLHRVDLAAFGCDSITPRGIVNKLGTAPLAEFARRNGKMNYFIGTTEKVIPYWNDDFLLRQGAKEEIYRGTGPVQVENYYFDLTPPRHIGGLFLETGLSRMFDDAKTSVSRR